MLAKQLSNSPDLSNKVAVNSNRGPGGHFEGGCHNYFHILRIIFNLC